ncbi:MAG: putrescine aminotransferase [Anaerolineales bacterium]|nr:MAG: putrescine aminotransferase [Anaerolineales bacterium]
MPEIDPALSYARRWLEIIQKPRLTQSEAEEIVQETVSNFANHFNRGFLEYRKSVTVLGGYAATEWRGEGALVEDVFGRQWIDCLGGYGLLDLGWSHPRVVEAVEAQLRRSPMPSQELLDPLRGVLARLLAMITPGDIQYFFFAAGGTEAVEGAMKLAKLYSGKSGFITSLRAFHGKTLGSLSLMGKKDFRKPVMPLYPNITWVPFGDAQAVERQLEIAEAVGLDIAAVIMEPIQGEAGAIVPPEDFWPRLRQLCDQYGVLLIADEVQTGMGRTGKMWGVDHWEVVPDIITLGKSLGGGVMPVSSFGAREEIWQVMMEPNPFIHTTTTGGNPLACAAAIAAITVTLEENLPQMAAEKGSKFKAGLEQLASKYPNFYARITGRGLLLAQHFHTPEIGYQIASGLFKRGVLVAGTLTNAKTIRIEPPIYISYEQIDTVLNHLEDTLREVNA